MIPPVGNQTADRRFEYMGIIRPGSSTRLYIEQRVWMTKSNVKFYLVALRVFFVLGIPFIYILLLASAYASEGGRESGYFGSIYLLDFWVFVSLIVFWRTQRKLSTTGLFFLVCMIVFCCLYTMIRLRAIYSVLA